MTGPRTTQDGSLFSARVEFTVTREYEMDIEKILRDFGPPEKHGQTRFEFLRESFFELCGFERDEDHIDGNYVRLVSQESDMDIHPKAGNG